MSESLKQQAKTYPSLSFTVDSNIDELIKKFKGKSTEFFEEHLNINDVICEFSTSNFAMIDSKIIKGDQCSMLKKWITDGTARFKLLYRGTRDGFTPQAFQEKVGLSKPTVVLVHSNSGNKNFWRFHGY